MPGKGLVIEANGLSKRFGDFTAVDNIDVAVSAGEVFGLLGANGAGKTTAIRMLCGILRPTSGQITVSNIDMVRHARDARGRIGYVTQRFSLYGELTVFENLRLQAGLYGLLGVKASERIEWALQRLGLGTHRNAGARTLPLGYQRRLALAAGLLHEPTVLFLDEPTSGVDPVARQHFWELIYDLAETGIGILITTHYMDEALFCDRLSLMQTGRIVEQGSPSELLRRPLPTPLLEVSTSEPGELTGRLSKWPEILEIIPRAGVLRLRIRQETTVDELIGKLREEPAILSISKAEAELEDIFVAVLEREARS